jgi:hypothetical protein
MEKKVVESHRDFAYGLLLIGVGFTFFALLGTFMIFMIAPKEQIGRQIMMTLLGLGSFAFAFYSLHHYLKDVPKIIVSTERIIIKSFYANKEIVFADIENIELGQKTLLPYGGFLSRSMESTIIYSKQFGKFVIWDHYYENISHLKAVLQKLSSLIKDGNSNFDDLTVRRKSANAKLEPVILDDVMREDFQVISGNRFLNFMALCFWGMFLFSIYVFKIESFILINGIFYGLIGYQSNYFLISNKYLQVRNHLWFWKRITYKLSNVKEVIYEFPGRMTQSARVVQVNFSTDLHPASSLKDEDWDALRNELEKRGVMVRDNTGIR